MKTMLLTMLLTSQAFGQVNTSGKLDGYTIHQINVAMKALCFSLIDGNLRYWKNKPGCKYLGSKKIKQVMWTIPESDMSAKIGHYDLLIEGFEREDIRTAIRACPEDSLIDCSDWVREIREAKPETDYVF